MIDNSIRTILALGAAIIVTYGLSSIFQTQMVLAGLQSVGAEIPLDMRLRTTGQDLAGLFGPLTIVIAIALTIGFTVAFGVKRILTPLAPIAYPLAGALALATALTLMKMQFGITPLTGTKGVIGFGLQLIAGAMGGLMFARIRPHTS